MTEEKIRMAYLLILISVSANLAQGIFIKQYNSKHNKGGFTFNALISLAAMMFFLVTDKEGYIRNYILCSFIFNLHSTGMWIICVIKSDFIVFFSVYHWLRNFVLEGTGVCLYRDWYADFDAFIVFDKR